ELEEERRLCYVGMTRAKERLFILSAGTRTIFGDLRYQTPSRFISEISSDFIEGDEASSATSTEPYYTLDESQLEPPTETKPLIDDYTFDENSENPWRIGMQVRHLSFGIGVVRAKEGQGENTKLTIHFKDAGQKKIIVKYAALSPA
ncbi:MAG: ATP-dependent DNA helicase PcrA, partial [Deltaproteobacteria bacterium]|nr:ATP-dependent DNA helicase PcrA [Deltaproteobacteria bacterium]